MSRSFLSPAPDQALAEKARALEAKGYFTKPLDTDAVLQCINKAVAAAGAN